MSPAFAKAVAGELVRLNGSLDRLLVALAGDPEVLRRHMTDLQAIDDMSQVQCALADLLLSDEPMGAGIDAVPLEAMAARLRDGIQATHGEI
ncbi:hypothetical protein [Sphingomonas gellani]|nr:hypothetical protein [Sphingomonas gellani]